MMTSSWVTITAVVFNVATPLSRIADAALAKLQSQQLPSAPSIQILSAALAIPSLVTIAATASQALSTALSALL
jgi:hypothetical protein